MSEGFPIVPLCTVGEKRVKTENQKGPTNNWRAFLLLVKSRTACRGARASGRLGGGHFENCQAAWAAAFLAMARFRRRARGDKVASLHFRMKGSSPPLRSTERKAFIEMRSL